MTRDDRLIRLESHAHKISGLYNDLLTQMAEVNLKLRFVLHCMRCVKPQQSVLLGPDDKPQVTLINGYEAYMSGGREQIAALIEQEITEFEAMLAEERARAEAAEIAAEAAHPVHGNGAGSPDAVDASPAAADPQAAFDAAGHPTDTRH